MHEDRFLQALCSIFFEDRLITNLSFLHADLSKIADLEKQDGTHKGILCTMMVSLVDTWYRFEKLS
jgi:hypothetical protein